MSYAVTVTPTIMDGTVVRWYCSEQALMYGNAALSASRHCVMGHGGHITPELFEAAWAAHLAITRGEDVQHLATHTRTRLFGGEWEPVTEATR